MNLSGAFALVFHLSLRPCPSARKGFSGLKKGPPPPLKNKWADKLEKNCPNNSVLGHLPNFFLFSGWEFPNLVVLNLVVYSFDTFALFCALLRSFAPFCALLQTCVCALLRSFALICALCCSFACLCERPRLERPRLGTLDLGEAEANIFPIFSYFGPEARNPLSSRQAGSQISAISLGLLMPWRPNRDHTNSTVLKTALLQSIRRDEFSFWERGFCHGISHEFFLWISWGLPSL